MDCHDPHTHFRLVGVYTETDGLYDWGEQLFKHHGYCQWDEDTYETMQDLLESWPTGDGGCKKLQYSDDNGNTLYAATKPLPEGNLTVALYYDEDCTQDSGRLYSDYILIYYENYYANYYYYYNYQNVGPSKAQSWLKNMDVWNSALNTYKICQPCRAYNLNPDSGSGSGSHDRMLGEDNDGGGDAEQWGYDCDDDAGYTNCNQVRAVDELATTKDDTHQIISLVLQVPNKDQHATSYSRRFATCLSAGNHIANLGESHLLRKGWLSVSVPLPY